MTRNSTSTIAHEYHAGMVVVCMHDHQMHDKLNYLGRYVVLSVSTFEKEEVSQYSGVCLEITARDHNNYWIEAERFVPEWYYEGKDNPMIDEFKQTMRMDERALADPQPVVKRTDEHYTSVAESAYDEADKKIVTRTQADKADAGKLSTLIFDQDFLEANLVTAQIFEYGAQKYSRESFYRIAFDDWEKAEGRHKRSRVRKDLFDDESGLLHLAHEAANKIVMLQLEVKRLLASGYTMEQLTKFNPPPQDHKNG